MLVIAPPPLIVDVAIAPVPVPVIITFGADVNPVPPLVTLIYMFIHPADPSGGDQAVFAHTLMAPAPSQLEGA